MTTRHQNKLEPILKMHLTPDGKVLNSQKVTKVS